MKTQPATEYALLGALMSGPRHGYDLVQFLNASLGSTWYVSTSQLYTLLKRLERLGLLRSSIEAQETRPSKRVFALSPEGKKAFDKWLRRPTKHVRNLRVEFLAKLFFFKSLSLEGGEGLVDAQVTLLEGMRENTIKLTQQRKNPYQLLVLDSKLATIELWIDWLGEKGRRFVTR